MVTDRLIWLCLRMSNAQIQTWIVNRANIPFSHYSITFNNKQYEIPRIKKQKLDTQTIYCEIILYIKTFNFINHNLQFIRPSIRII